jgi:membrane protein DedA with SNARE-associated domain
MRTPIAHLPEITYPIVFLAVFAAQLGVPVPAILFLAAAGTLAALGKMNLLLVIMGATVGCLIGDYAWFLAGRRTGTRALRVLTFFSSDRRTLVKNARQAFHRWGVYSFLIAKFIPGLDTCFPLWLAHSSNRSCPSSFWMLRVQHSGQRSSPIWDMHLQTELKLS